MKVTARRNRKMAVSGCFGLVICIWAIWLVRCYLRTLSWKTGSLLFLVDGYNQPDSAKTQFNMGVTYINLKQYDKARLFLTRSIGIDPSSVLPYWRLGHIAIFQQNFTDAQYWLSQCIGKYGGSMVVKDEEVFNDLAIVQHQTGAFSESRKNLLLALASNDM
eukprot:GHVQ01029048.1.p1 GENE.GHVQ01029048.1~~GHVQ01029048.1.p1  ORF type:complete len:170 (+),score=7.60 GHVQ01029048.1:25-510(+)